jgi:hypothetical protein
VSEEKEGSPKNGGPHGKVIVEVARGCAKFRLGLAIFVEARGAKTFVGVPVVFGEIEIVLNERGAGKCVVPYAIAADPGIKEWERKQKEKKQHALRFARTAKRRWAEALLIHEQNTRRKLLLSPAINTTVQHHNAEPISQYRGRNLVVANNRSSIVPHDVIWS